VVVKNSHPAWCIDQAILRQSIQLKPWSMRLKASHKPSLFLLVFQLVDFNEAVGPPLKTRVAKKYGRFAHDSPEKQAWRMIREVQKDRWIIIK